MKLKEMRKEKRNGMPPLSALRQKMSLLKWLDPFTYSDLFLDRIGKKDDKIISWAAYLFTAALSAFVLYNLFALVLGTRFPGVIVLSGSMEPLFYRGDIIIMQGVQAEALQGARVRFNGSIKGMPLSYYAQTYCSRQDGSETKPCEEFKEDYSNGKILLQEFTAKKIIFNNGEELEITAAGDIVIYHGYVYNWAAGSQSFEPIIHRVVAIIEAEDGLFVLTKGDSRFNSFIDQETGIAPSAVPVRELEGRLVAIIPKLGYVKLILLDDIPCIALSPFTGRSCPFP